MRASEYQLYVQETQVRPNRAVCISMAVIVVAAFLTLLMNELGIFRVPLQRMRWTAAAVIVLLNCAMLYTLTGDRIKGTATKFFLLGCVDVAVFLACTVLFFHYIPVTVLPMLLGSLYPSRRVCRLSMLACLAVAVLAPVSSMLLGLWDPDYLKYLTQLSLRSSITIDMGAAISPAESVRGVLLYISLPNALILMAFYPLALALSNHGEERLKKELEVIHMSESDALTGLLNRTCYEERLLRGVSEEDRQVLCMYVDANGLHRINNELGHDAGDRLLICVAQTMRLVLGDERVYRIGGDEFVAIVTDCDLGATEDLAEEIRRGVARRGYSVSIGWEQSSCPCSLKPLLTAAEAKMMIEKTNANAARQL